MRREHNRSHILAVHDAGYCSIPLEGIPHNSNSIELLYLHPANKKNMATLEEVSLWLLPRSWQKRRLWCHWWWNVRTSDLWRCDNDEYLPVHERDCVNIKAAESATNLTDGAHGPHVAFIARTVLGWGQQRFGVEEGFGVQGIQASIDWNLTHRSQVTVAPDLQFGGMLCRDPDRETTGV